MAEQLPKEVGREVRRTLADLRSAHLAATAWPVVAGDLGRLAKAVDQRDDEAVRKALMPVAQATFEGKVRGRLAGANRAAAYMGNTGPGLLRSPLLLLALPLVLLAAWAAQVLVGLWLAGAVLGLAVVAVGLWMRARDNPDGVERRQREAMAPTMERTEPIPSVVAEAIHRIEAALREGSGPPA